MQPAIIKQNDDNNNQHGAECCAFHIHEEISTPTCLPTQCSWKTKIEEKMEPHT